jgi:glutamate-ammonia-ligase adenylyltransferase
VRIPDLSFYSEAELNQVRERCPQFQYYEGIVSRSPQSPKDQLRIHRHIAWMKCVAAEVLQQATTSEVCAFWSETADTILQEVCSRLSQKLDCKLALFAYGKLGSQELNLSSDIDLVLISDAEVPSAPAFLRQLQSEIQEMTDFGFCFRNDFDLRPGGRMGPLIPTCDQFQDYYGNYGEAWERLALVRLRPIWGSEDLIQDVLKFTEKFVFRKHLDYTLLSDLQSLRQRIHSQYFHRSREDQLDLKLGVGGIRDLELFVHTLQVVHGGRDPSLRQRQTQEALRLLCDKEILPESEVNFLQTHYWTLRHWENLVQAKYDQQTHLLLKAQWPEAPFAKLRQQMNDCDQLVSGLLGKVNLQDKSVPASEAEQHQWLSQLGFTVNEVSELWRELMATTALSRQKERDESYRLRFLYLFLTELSRYPQQLGRSLYLLRDFLKATRAKAAFYSLFLAQENLIASLARIFSSSPYLASLLCSRPELIDSYVYRTQEAAKSSEPQILLDQLSERKLLSELVNGTEFINSLDLEQLTVHMTETADRIATDLLDLVARETGCQLDVLALGKWGGSELGLRSDLDFIFVTDDEPDEQHIKAARRFFHRLTESHHRGGSLYSIDLRLRPSGKGGLVVTSYQQLQDYLRVSAEPWERQAYLRSRFLDPKRSADPLHRSCYERPLAHTELQKLNEIRLSLLKNEITTDEGLDLKYSEGGLVDIEFAAQVALLKTKSLSRPRTEDQLHQLGWTELIEHYNFMRLIEQIYQVVVLTSTSFVQFSSDSFESTALLLRENKQDLQKRLRSALDDSQHLLKRLDPRRTG